MANGEKSVEKMSRGNFLKRTAAGAAAVAVAGGAMRNPAKAEEDNNFVNKYSGDSPQAIEDNAIAEVLAKSQERGDGAQPERIKQILGEYNRILERVSATSSEKDMSGTIAVGLFGAAAGGMLGAGLDDEAGYAGPVGGGLGAVAGAAVGYLFTPARTPEVNKAIDMAKNETVQVYYSENANVIRNVIDDYNDSKYRQRNPVANVNVRS